MFVTLMRKKEPVCTLSVGCLSLAGPIVYKYKILNQELLPFPFKETYTGEAMKMLLRLWIEDRVISNENPDLDETMCSVYGLDQAHYGRMHDYQYIGAFLSYLTSAHDDYWVNPDYTQYLSYVLVDPHFYTLYTCVPTTFEKAKAAGGRFRKCLKNP